MRPSRLSTVLFAAGFMLALGTGWSSASAAVTAAGAHAGVLAGTAGTSGSAVEVPGTATLNQDGDATTNSVSCASAGNCSAGGSYTDGSGNTQAFVVSETGGVWGAAQEVPGTATLNQGGFAAIDSVSCASAGNCSAVGAYSDSSLGFQAFVVNETGGVWGAAQEVPGTATLNQGGSAEADSVSCASAGNCSAGGNYTDGSSKAQVFVVSETGGVWGAAQEVPGSATLNQDGYAELNSVSCASAGNCSAGGNYTDAGGNQQVFVVSETGGVWGPAEELPGTATLNKDAGGDDEQLQSVSCASAGNCATGGSYTDGSGKRQAFVASQTGGVWAAAEEVPGTATLNKGGETAYLNSVSCTSAGNCSAGGDYSNASGDLQAFVVSETGGVWGAAQEVPGTATLNKDGYADTYAVSCASAGNCSAVGPYKDSSGHFQVFVASETGGVWAAAQEVPGTATLNQGGNDLAVSVSCPSAGNCAIGGYYTDGSGSTQAFVATTS
jgi:hypothetical protein